MKKNIGTTDRLIRLAFAIIAFFIALFSNSWTITILFSLIGLFCLYEALASWCAFYQLIGKNTCRIDPNRKQ
jgi:hypothetical protein